MVRLMCQNSPRACCGDEGDKVDKNRAERAVSALVKPEEKIMKLEEKIMTFGTFFSENECSNDSGTVEMSSEGLDSDSDSDNLHIVLNENNSNPNNDNNNINKIAKEKRSERRRERNKRSAQAYRQRRKQQQSAADETMHELLQKNYLLHEKLNKLEEEKAIVLGLLKTKIKIPWPYPAPYPVMMWENQNVTMSTPMAMDSVVQEVTVAS